MSLFGYYYLGLQSMSAAQLGLQVAGDNIANALTPGYARRRLELASGFPVEAAGGFLSQGVDAAGLRRMEDVFFQANLQRELGKQAGSEERLRGLRELEAVFGQIDAEGGIAGAMSDFAASFDELAGRPDDLALRQDAVFSAERLAGAIRSAHSRLQERRTVEDAGVESLVGRVNSLAEQLAGLNREIAVEEGAGGVAAPLRDKRQTVIEELSELTGGTAVTAANGRVQFSFAAGPTLVTGDDALPLSTSRAADGTLRILSGADRSDVTDRLRQGQIGARLYLRDDAITDAMNGLDQLAAELIVQANTLTTGAFDLQGNAGGPLFEPDPPTNPGSAGTIAVSAALLQDPALLAVSSTGAPGEGDVAALLAGLPEQSSAALNGRSPAAFFAEMLQTLGEDVVQTDVAESVSRSLVDNLTAQRDAVSGVSLDEEAVALMQYQRTYEATARFIQVLNSVTEVAVNLLSR